MAVARNEFKYDFYLPITKHGPEKSKRLARKQGKDMMFFSKVVSIDFYI